MLKSVLTPVANLYSDHSFMSDQTTQALMGETLEIVDSSSSWYKVKQWDSYESWIHKFYLTDKKNISFEKYYFDLHTNKLIGNKGNILFIPFGVELPIYKRYNDHIIVIMPNGNKARYDLPFKQYFSNRTQKLVSNIKKFIGVHYQWGGVSTFGCDCSGFVQTIFKSVSIKLPRDCYLQYENLKKVDYSKIKIGDLLFFKVDQKINHVAILSGKTTITHCSGYVKETSLNPKDLSYDKELMNNYYLSMSVEGLR